jgi:hypothetical protein
MNRRIPFIETLPSNGNPLYQDVAEQWKDEYPLPRRCRAISRGIPFTEPSGNNDRRDIYMQTDGEDTKNSITELYNY